MWPLGSMMVNGESEICDDSSSQQGCTPPHCFSQPCAPPQQVSWPIWPILNMFIQFHMHTHTQSTAILLYQPLITSCTKVLLGHVMLCWGFFCTGVCVCVQCCGGVWRRILLQILQEAACRFFVMFFWQGGYRNYPSSI